MKISFTSFTSSISAIFSKWRLRLSENLQAAFSSAGEWFSFSPRSLAGRVRELFYNPLSFLRKRDDQQQVKISQQEESLNDTESQENSANPVVGSDTELSDAELSDAESDATMVGDAKKELLSLRQIVNLQKRDSKGFDQFLSILGEKTTMSRLPEGYNVFQKGRLYFAEFEKGFANNFRHPYGAEVIDAYEQFVRQIRKDVNLS